MNENPKYFNSLYVKYKRTLKWKEEEIYILKYILSEKISILTDDNKIISLYYSIENLKAKE